MAISQINSNTNTKHRYRLLNGTLACGCCAVTLRYRQNFVDVGLNRQNEARFLLPRQGPSFSQRSLRKSVPRYNPRKMEEKQHSATQPSAFSKVNYKSNSRGKTKPVTPRANCGKEMKIHIQFSKIKNQAADKHAWLPPGGDNLLSHDWNSFVK